MRRTIFIISALAGALGVSAPALAQSDDLLGDDEYPADDYVAPSEEQAVPADEPAYDDSGSTTDSYGDSSYGDSSVGDSSVGDSSYGYDDPAPYDRGAVSTNQFQRTLAPYGRWVRTPEYGLVWIPSQSVVGNNFVPYATGGNWRYSNAGWTFVSDWNWGWAPFHYGRWYRAPRLGWVWLPGSVWAPAWVDWRYGDGYIGWAPLPPRRFAAALRYHDYWFFCSARNLWRRNVWRYRVRSTPALFRVAVLARRPVARGRARWFAGPNPRLIERVARRPVARVDIRPRRARVDRRIETPRQQRIQRQQRIEMPRQQRIDRRQERVERQQRIQVPRQQRVEQAQPQQRFDRQREMRVERQQQQRAERQQQRAERQQQRAERQPQQRAERQQQRVQRQQEHRVQRQQAREQRQPTRERRRRPDR